MALTFRILPRHNLVYVKYSGHMSIAESYEKLAEYQAHPAYSPEQRHFVDLSDATSYDTDPTALMKMQAEKIDVVTLSETPLILAYFAPHEVAMAAARATLRSWEGLDHVVPVLCDTLDAMFDVLGLPVTSLDDLLTPA